MQLPRPAGFFFAAQSDNWISVLRVGLGIQVVLYCLSLRADWNRILAGTGRGLISRQLSEFVLSGESPLIPRLGWLVNVGSQFGLSEVTLLTGSWACLPVPGCFLVTGLFCRAAAIVSWFLYLCSVRSGGLLAYGMDQLTTVGLFYLMISPLPDRCSLDCLFRMIPVKSHRSGFIRRMLQIHLCIIYLVGGLAKCVGPGWWNGDSIWRALSHPPFNVIAPEILVRWRTVFPIAGITVWAIELGYPLLIWSKRTRNLWLICTIGMHVAIGVTMGMYLFALIMIVLNLAAFGPDWMRTGHAAAQNTACDGDAGGLVSMTSGELAFSAVKKNS
jgi:hypothetical protein